MSKNKLDTIKYVHFKDILSCFIFLFMIPIALIAKIFIHDFWLVGEEKNEARDNGYWFFKYVCQNHPDQKIAYVINKKCSDYENVKNLGKTIQWGGLSHWFWYLVAKKNISSQKGCKPNAAACYLFEVKLRLWRNKRYFLQHGITINDAKWLYFNNCRFELFVCGAKPEYDFVKEKFGYTEKNAKLLGFCRFDGLHDVVEKKRQILVMPTWREYLVRPHGVVSENDLKNHFLESEYFKKWSEFLCCDTLQKSLENKDYTLLFYPHRNMQIFLDDFNRLDIGKRVKIAKPNELSVQDALKESACLITDYSSVFFDFAYMKKPVIFYQFDESEYRAKQYGQGYFDYHNNVLGKWAGTLSDCLAILQENMINDFPVNTLVNEFFKFNDKDNCKRTYEEIKGK